MDKRPGPVTPSAEHTLIGPAPRRVRPDAPTRQTRFENNPRGRAVINVGLVVTLAAILISLLPASTIRDRMAPAAQPYLTALGVGEDWSVFAPNPRPQVIYAGGVFKYADRSVSVWNFPLRPGIMAYRDYRWQKYEERIRQDAYRGLWKAFATYLATHEALPGKKLVQVDLARKWATINPPGAPTSLGPWTQYTFYAEPIGGTK